MARVHAQQGIHQFSKYQETDREIAGDTPSCRARLLYEYVHEKLSHGKILIRKSIVEHYTAFFGCFDILLRHPATYSPDIFLYLL
jgi:hypothetical protein